MRKKAAFSFGGTNELSRLLTRERLSRAGVKLASPGGADPDLAELLDRVPSSTVRKTRNAPVIPHDLVRKLAGG